jgi:hypothetical protein
MAGNNEKLDYGVIDDFLPSDVFAKLQTFLLYPELVDNSIPVPLWQYNSKVVYNLQDEKKKEEEDWRLFYLTHMVYDNTIKSPVYEQIEPINELLGIRALMRIKINMYPNTETIKEHGMHIDYPYSHNAAILSINTCNGYTKLEDGTKIDSIANRMLIFDGRIKHTSSTCTNQPIRMNINFNYF